MAGHRSTHETFGVAYRDLRGIGFPHDVAVRDARAAADHTARLLDESRGSHIRTEGASARPNPHRVPFPWERTQHEATR